MADEQLLLEQLSERDIRPTALRLLILRTMEAMGCAASLTDLETKLGTVDKSTIFRTLTLFAEHHLVHVIDDGSGSTKYAVCASDCHCGEPEDDGFLDHHAHFFCERCHRTFCFTNLPVPSMATPAGFQLHTASYLLKGLCPECASRD